MRIDTPFQATDKVAWSIEQWLNYLGEIHPTNIELGLERVLTVFKRLNINFKTKTVITVAGTNGKGTTCAMIEQALLMQGQSVGVFSSPHLVDYRERVRIQGDMLSQLAHCHAFYQIEKARKEISLTYFEFGTLQALWLMAQADCDYVLLEVGLGGRLDAVNIIDPDIAVITSIDLDHQEWLGNTRDAIATEKAGIFRPHIAVVIGEPEPPESLIYKAKENEVVADWQGQAFQFELNSRFFSWRNSAYCFADLPKPLIPAQNASTALQVLSVLKFDLSHTFVEKLFKQTCLQGRRQIVQYKPTVMLDVAHNPHATRLLASEIQQQHYHKVFAVVGMLGDKDMENSLKPMLNCITQWNCASLAVPRGAKANQLVSVLSAANLVLEFNSVHEAYSAAQAQAQDQDLIVVFGSFYTVAEVLLLLKEN